YSRIRLLLHCVSTVMSSTDTSTLSLHDALPILEGPPRRRGRARHHRWGRDSTDRGGGRHADGQPDRAAGARRGGTRRARVAPRLDRKSTRLNSSHVKISYAVFCLKKKKRKKITS